MQFAINALLSFFAPPRSLGGALGHSVTEQELRVLRALEPFTMDAATLRRRGIRSLDRIVAGAHYGASPVLRAALARWKYRGGAAYAGVCAEVLLRAVPLLEGGGVLCPVPLHWSRRWWRGFNQADVLARVLGGAAGLPVYPLLQRKRPTGAQARRTHAKRRHALDDAFASSGIVPPHVVLVDDVMTTGSTLDACARTLRRAGCQRVDAIVIAA